MIESKSIDINVVVLVKELESHVPESYIFVYTDENRVKVLSVFGRFAENPELSFTWYDAAALSQKIRQKMPKTNINFLKWLR